jgi:hypothetical protein
MRIRVDELHTHRAFLLNPGDGGWVGLKMLTQNVVLRYVDRKWKRGREDVQNMAGRTEARMFPLHKRPEFVAEESLNQ